VHGGRSTRQRPAAMRAALRDSRRRFYRKYRSPAFRLAAAAIEAAAGVAGRDR